MAFASIAVGDALVRIEYEWVGPAAPQAPTMVFLHEGLGSVAMWRDFPARLCAAAGLRGLVYSRPGYGRSTPRPAQQRWQPDFMHRQAREVLPALLQALDVRQPWLFGHSDGGSIALLFAAAFPTGLSGAIVLAPHIMVEEVSVRSIAQVREAYLHTDLKQRLARHHDDVDSAFWGWNDIWLDPAFRDWAIEEEIAAIRCPVLAIQGLDDEYGTLEQIRGIARRVPQTRLLELSECGHSPHRDRAEVVIAAVTRFVADAAV
ncbi:alpha/beta hydrolase [Ramlibacter sp.]|uniref:alpha/beta fold hydrolase n=1 Tax=Ramlibacter sp. TaxID=1917967 RepID=UPI0026192AC3|nr:alpha/beta hydrolase [Ramlibacter sp.]MDB5957968.1 alpha/beta hydrolase [Ramlibacter sp.]